MGYSPYGGGPPAYPGGAHGGGAPSQMAFAPSAESPAAGEAGITFKRTFHLDLLLRKLQTFETLIGSDQFAKAAVVADDIQMTFDHFDPTLYFPQLFASYLRLLVMHSEQMMNFAQAKDSAEWKALLNYYRSDLEGFINF
jgi:hypothetical protein